MNSKRKSALTLAVIATIMYVIIFSLPAYGGSSSGYGNVTLTMAGLINNLGGSYNILPSWVVLMIVIIGTVLLFSDKTIRWGFALMLSGHAISLTATINYYVTYSNGSIRLGGVLEYFILFFAVLSISLYAKSVAEEANFDPNQPQQNNYQSFNPQPQAPSYPSSNQQRLSKDDQDKLKFWKDLLDQELITKEEYDKKKKEILGL